MFQTPSTPRQTAYTALGRHERTRALAREIFAEATAGYHGVARRVVETVMEKYPR